MTALFTALVALASTQAPAPETTPEPTLEVRHLPVADAEVGADIVLHATVKQAWKLGRLSVHYRTAGEQSFREVAFAKSVSGDFSATVPGANVQRPALEYYVDARDTDGRDSAFFASAQAPHPVVVNADPTTLHHDPLVELYGRRRSRASVFGEYVDYGGRFDRAGNRYPDWYYRGEIDYLYRTLAPLGDWFRVDSIRIGVGTMRSNAPPLGAFTSSPLIENAGAVKGGIDYGLTEVDTSFSPMLGLSAKFILGGNSAGFATGFGARLRVGSPRRAHVDLGGETVSGIGSTADLRLAWDTVPRVPMSATVSVTDVPEVSVANLRTGAVGVRFVYRADWEMTDGFTLGGQLGYQARAAVGGGLSFALSTALAW